jgi:uncharacterized protein
MIAGRLRTQTVMESYSLGQTVLLHLGPGLVTLLLFLGMARLLWSFQLPSFLALSITLLCVFALILGYLLYQNTRLSGRPGLGAVIDYRQPIPWWQHVVFFVALFGWSLIWLALLGPAIDDAIRTRMFAFVPAWFMPDEIEQNFAGYSRPVRIITWCSLLVAYTFGAIVEELYFRGYLLPKMARFGRWAPLFHSTLFAIYHLETLWQTPTRLIAVLPGVYLVWWKRNIWISMIWHTTVNVIAVLLLIPLFFSP